MARRASPVSRLICLVGTDRHLVRETCPDLETPNCRNMPPRNASTLSLVCSPAGLPSHRPA
eukprot:358299-Chlamydomonas_euryale.AAC.8